MEIFNELTYINKSSLALGFFDGLHQGHRVVLKNTINIARENSAKACVIMFKTHPQTILSKNKTEQLLTNDEKLKMLEELGIDCVFLLDFEKIQNVSAEEYLENILIKYFHPTAITTGFNHFFGFNRTGNCEFLQNNSEKYGYKYYAIPPYVLNNTIVSSSQIRNKLNIGDISDANQLLGYQYFIQGIVEHGEKIASKLGFPSANIKFPQEKVKIPYGVYFVKVNIENKEYNGVLNYGIIKNELKTEVHIIDFSKNIYEKNIKISFITKIRNQINFENTEKLQAQIKRDIAFVEIYKHFTNTNVNFRCKNFLM